MIAISDADDGTHPVPPGADQRWQETFFATYYDPVRRVGGFHHMDVATARRRYSLHSWLCVDGEVVGHTQSLDMPLSGEADMSALDLGSVQVNSLTPLREYAITAAHGAVRADITYRAVVDPFSLRMEVDGSTFAAGHYESGGRVTGELRLDGHSIAVEGFAFADHSWGPRDYGSLNTRRWCWAMFGEDYFASIYTMSSDQGRSDFGYVYEDGEFHPVSTARFGTRVDDDGHTPLGASVRVWTADGRGYRFDGEVQASNPYTHDGGFFVTDGMVVWESGPRLGAGMIQVNELKRPTPAHHAWLGLQ